MFSKLEELLTEMADNLREIRKAMVHINSAVEPAKPVVAELVTTAGVVSKPYLAKPVAAAPAKLVTTAGVVSKPYLAKPVDAEALEKARKKALETKFIKLLKSPDGTAIANELLDMFGATRLQLVPADMIDAFEAELDTRVTNL